MSETSNGTGEWPQGQGNTSSPSDALSSHAGTDQQATTIEAADTPQTHEAVRKIEALRATIDNIDAAVVHLLAERFKATSQVGVLKAQAGFAPADLQRE